MIEQGSRASPSACCRVRRRAAFPELLFQLLPRRIAPPADYCSTRTIPAITRLCPRPRSKTFFPVRFFFARNSCCRGNTSAPPRRIGRPTSSTSRPLIKKPCRGRQRRPVPRRPSRKTNRTTPQLSVFCRPTNSDVSSIGCARTKSQPFPDRPIMRASRGEKTFDVRLARQPVSRVIVAAQPVSTHPLGDFHHRVNEPRAAGNTASAIIPCISGGMPGGLFHLDG